jgi:L-alanine-DL-glutamate epimerase-like enolase superfamily enzyme
MRIEKIIIYRVSSTAKLQYGKHSRNSLKTLIVEMKAGGQSGWGECADVKFKKIFDPFRSCRYLAKRIIGRDLINLSDLLKFSPGKSIENDIWSYGYNAGFRAAREAFSIAAYDLYGKHFKQPVFKLLGNPNRLNFPGMPVIHISDPKTMATISKTWVSKGYNFLKIKLGQKGSYQRLNKIREYIGQNIDLHVDFNLSCSKEKNLANFLNDLHEQFNISVFEDPIPCKSNVYQNLKSEVSTKIMMDSGVFYPRIKSIAKNGMCDLINHHTDRQGGLDLALLISKVASNGGIEDAIGSSGLAGISEVAFQSLASNIGLLRPCESILFSNYSSSDFNGFYGTEQLDICKSHHTYNAGSISLNDIPGIGITVDKNRLKYLSSKTLQIQ